MRFLVLLLLLGACHGGFFTTGVGVLEPDLGDTLGTDAGMFTSIGAGIGVIENGAIEFLGGASTGDDDHVLAGVGWRGHLKDFYIRGGAAYHDIDFTNGWGSYLGFGYDFYFDEERRLSLGPEVMLYQWWADVPTLFGSESEDVLSVAVGISLTYRFGGKKERSPLGSVR